jgi:HD-like signal output (HDOD) protein/DNA-binding NarL/FixJ family response regulator
MSERITALIVCGDTGICGNIKKVLEGLPFDIDICASGEQGIDLQLEKSRDIVISDYQLPDMSGFEFLNKILKVDKFSTRIIVGGQADEEQIIKSVIKGVACTFISSKSEELIRRKLQDIVKIRNEIKNEKLVQLAPGSKDFPIKMTVYEHFMDAVNRDADIREITKIIAEDVVLTSKVLRVANSAFYGNFNGTSVEKAILYMGLNPVKDIVLMHSLEVNLNMNNEQNKYLEDIVKHSIETNYYMNAIAGMVKDCPITNLNSSVGIIHDIGKIAQLVFFPLEYKSITEYREENPEVDYYTCELKTGNTTLTHSEIGAYFLRCWNFNQYSIEAALYHHEPEMASDDMKPCVEALFLANTLADVRDGYELSLEEAVSRCKTIDISVEKLEKILPPM